MIGWPYFRLYLRLQNKRAPFENRMRRTFLFYASVEQMIYIDTVNSYLGV